MTAMPQMVALFNGVGGGAAALIALAEFHDATPIPGDLDLNVSVSIVLSALIGSISFAGSAVAFAKLQELIGGRPIVYPGQKVVNGVLLAAIAALGHRDHRRRRGRGVLVAARRRRARVRRAVRAADRRRGHAGRDLAAERVHRARGGRDRLRAARERADRRRDARRRVGDDADPDDGAARWAARSRTSSSARSASAGAGAAAAAAGDGRHGARDDARRTWPSCSRTRSA